jgi:uncharacterized membrane protein YfcA
LNFSHAILLFFAGALGGAMNAVAGGGSFVAFPALLFTGVPPIPANATNTLSLWVGTAVSGGAYRNRLNLPRRVLLPLLSMSLLGGLAGALLLIKTPAHTFLRVIPWLMLGATCCSRLAATSQAAFPGVFRTKPAIPPSPGHRFLSCWWRSTEVISAAESGS